MIDMLKVNACLLATENLKEEHRIILHMIKILLVASDKLEKGEAVSPDVFKKAGDFVGVFADRCHHGKEEGELFPALERKGILKHRGPIAVMLMEHELGRLFVKGLNEAVEKYERGDKTAKNAIVENARGYADLLDQHIYKEDNILYPMGDKVLSEADNGELLEKFEGIEKDMIGEGKHEYYLQMIADLEKELGIVGGGEID
jgi:hemerythrin-like domain-containing protein